MKVLTLCLFMLLLVAHAQIANWGGTWYNDVTRDNICCPAGLMVITQDDTGKTTVRGKWDEYAAKCKAFKLAGEKIEQDGTVAIGNTLVLDFTSPTGDKIIITLTRKDKDNSQITCQNGLIPTIGGLYLKTDNTKFGEFIGSWSLEPASGSSDRCCFPDSYDVKSPEDAVYVSNIKWSDSVGCKDVQLSDQKWDSAHTNVVPNPPLLTQNKLLDNGTVITHYIKKGDNDALIYYNSFTTGTVCNATLKKSSNSVLWIVIGAIVLAVLVIGIVAGIVIHKKRKQRAPEGTDTEYGRMVSA